MAVGEDNAYWTIKKEILEDLREKLVKDLQPEKLFAFLRSKKVLDEDDCEEINAEKTRRKKAEALLDILGKKGQNGFDYFCEAFVINSKTQLHLLKEILTAFESRIYSNEVEQLPIVNNEREIINIEFLNQKLPKPGEPGAPCLPGALGLVNGQAACFEMVCQLIGNGKGTGSATSSYFAQARNNVYPTCYGNYAHIPFYVYTHNYHSQLGKHCFRFWQDIFKLAIQLGFYYLWAAGRGLT